MRALLIATILALASPTIASAEPVAPARTIGPYSPIVAAGELRFLSGQVAIDPATGKLDPTLSIEEQTHRVWANIAKVLEGEGLSLTDVVQAQVYLTDMNEFAPMNVAYAAALGDHRPARTTVEVSALPLGARIEIAVVAMKRPPN